MASTPVGLRILIVEDNPARVDQFRLWLNHPRIRLIHVRSGDGALRCLEERWDAILLDHDLLFEHPLGRERARIDGRGVVRRLIERGVNRQTPCIIHSMNPGGRNAMYQLLRANRHDVLIKPFDDWSEKWAHDLRAELLETLDDPLHPAGPPSAAP